MLLRFIGGTDYNSEQRLDNVNGTYLVLASGKRNQNNSGTLVHSLIGLGPLANSYEVA